ncbi:hypothetical protein [Acidaminobacter hydrogenoformans]|uniref:hypothetical protein n=1 Tax=Acidaminobacter hydrogenoformans TaxID=65403 RepID=UPI001113B902|nr:hypothetical protein [Acidaminobacter hydrogenoformans]
MDEDVVSGAAAISSWVLRTAGQALAGAFIGFSPPPILMAGRTHCRGRFDHARAVTVRKYHDLMHEVLAG